MRAIRGLARTPVLGSAGRNLLEDVLAVRIAGALHGARRDSLQHHRLAGSRPSTSHVDDATLRASSYPGMEAQDVQGPRARHERGEGGGDVVDIAAIRALIQRTSCC